MAEYTEQMYGTASFLLSRILIYKDAVLGSLTLRRSSSRRCERRDWEVRGAQSLRVARHREAWGRDDENSRPSHASFAPIPGLLKIARSSGTPDMQGEGAV